MNLPTCISSNRKIRYTVCFVILITLLSLIHIFNGIFEMILDNVTILPQNSCNRDIREMRANELKLKIREPEITAFVEEGYKVYDADGNLKEKKEDIPVSYTHLSGIS